MGASVPKSPVMFSLRVPEAGYGNPSRGMDVIEQHLPWKHSQLIHSQKHAQLTHNYLPNLRFSQDQSSMEMIVGSMLHDEQKLCLDVVSQSFTFFLFIGDNQLELWAKHSETCETAWRVRHCVGWRTLSLFDTLNSSFPACISMSAEMYYAASRSES